MSSISASVMAPFKCRPVIGFEKLNRIGEGTYGTVYRAKDKQSGEIVALKKLKFKMEDGFPLTSVMEPRDRSFWNTESSFSPRA